MIVPAAALWLALAGGASGSVTVETIDEDRYRLSTALRSTSDPMDYAEAQMRLIREARRLCGRTGRPVSVGAIEVNRAEPGRGRRGTLVISETYSCASGR